MGYDDAEYIQGLDEARAQDTSLEPFFALILDRRNEGMLAKILPMFEREGESIVTVGAAHLHGARGLLPMLTDLGAEIDIVNPEGPASPTMLALARRRPPVLTSQEDAFQVDLGARSVRQQLPIPGSEQSMRLHVTSLGPGTQLLVTVVPTDAASDAGRRAALDRAMERGMRAAGLQSGTPEQVTLGGRPASRVSGESDTAGAVCVGAVHDGRVYTLLGLFSGSDPAQHQKMRAQFERAQRSFRFLQAPERRARPTGARSPVDVPPVGP